MTSDTVELDFLLTSITNYLLPIATWVLIGMRRSASTHYWCLGQVVLAGAVLMTGTTEVLGGIDSRAGFLTITLAFFFCSRALEIELGKKTDIKMSVFIAAMAYSCFELIYQYGADELKTAFVQFIYAAWLCYMPFISLSIYKQKNAKNAKWLAYTYIPALLGLLQLPNLNDLYSHHIHPLTQEDIALFSLLLSAILSQFAFLAMFFEINSTDSLTTKFIKNELTSANSPEGQAAAACPQIQGATHITRLLCASESTPEYSLPDGFFDCHKSET